MINGLIDRWPDRHDAPPAEAGPMRSVDAATGLIDGDALAAHLAGAVWGRSALCEPQVRGQPMGVRAPGMGLPTLLALSSGVLWHETML